MVYGCNKICALAQKKNVVMTVYLIITTFLFFLRNANVVALRFGSYNRCFSR